jgi:hypothetical protein
MKYKDNIYPDYSNSASVVVSYFEPHRHIENIETLCVVPYVTYCAPACGRQVCG